MAFAPGEDAAHSTHARSFSRLRMMMRPQRLLLATAATAALLGASAAVPHGSGSAQTNRSAAFVDTELGAIEGRVRGDVHEFLGVPFAKPPVEELRFAPPQPPAAWAGVHDATEFKHNCMQGSMNMGWPQPLSTQSEDCVRHRPRRPLPCRP